MCCFIDTLDGADACGSAPAPTELVVTMPPMAAEYSEEIMRDMGRVGFHDAGHFWLLGTTHYVWYTLDGIGWDPALYDATLATRTGIEVTMTGGSRTAPQVAAATATTIDAVGGFTASASGADVTIGGATTAAAGSVTWDTMGEVGIRGMQTYDLAGLNNFANGATSGVMLDPSRMPVGPVLVSGFRFTAGDLHTAQVTAAVYQGGPADDDFETATLVGVCGVTSGSLTDGNLYAAAAVPFLLDPSAGRVWVLWSHDAGGFRAPYVFTTETNPVHVAARDTSDWIIVGTDCTREINTIPLTSNPADWPASLGPVTGATIGMPTIALSFVTAASIQNDMVVTGRLGTREEDTSLFVGTSSNTLAVGNALFLPATAGMTVRDAEVAYAVHSAGSDYRLSLAVGGASDTDFSGATFTDLGRATGTSTGWVRVTPTPGDVALPPSTRVRLMIHHLASGTTELAFDPGDPDVYGPPSNPAAYYLGNTTESEADDGTLGGTPTTNIDFSEAVPLVGVVTPNGTIYNNNNNPGVRGTYEVLGFSVAA